MTHRHFGIMRGSASLGGASTDRPSARDAILPRDLKHLPREYLHPRGDFAQTLIDVATIVVAAVLVTATGIGLAASLFILMFVRL